MARENALRSLAIRSEYGRKISFHRSGSDLEIFVVILRTAARSMKKKDGRAEILSSKMRSLGKLVKPWERKPAKQLAAPAVDPKNHFGK